MEKEKEQEMEWIEAQKIEINVDLVSAAKKQLQFLGAVDRNRWLYDGPTLDKAIYRYNAYWLPLLAKSTDSSISEGPLVPPLDCEWIWHCHRLNPVRYKSDCEQFYGKFLGNSGVVSSVNGYCKSQTENLWKRLYPMEPYDLDLNDMTLNISPLENCTTYDLVSAVKRQSPFHYQVSREHVNNDIFLQEAVARYKGFLYLIKRNRERAMKLFCVPTYDVDLIWHTHQLHPVAYCKDLEKLIGKVLEHDDTDSDRGKGKKLDTGFSGTTAQWEETFGRRYWKAGAMYKGNVPAPITISPCMPKVLRKDSITKSDCPIQFPELKFIEVLLEIIGVKNLPDSYNGKAFVVFSKTQPDSLFNAERRLSILSETGEKQVASFQCEPTGKLSFQLMSSSSTSSKMSIIKEPKSLGFSSFSLEEFLFPVTKLSVEKWLEVTPVNNKADISPISLRVALSFTPPACRPTVLHMVQVRPSLKDTCFFPMIGKIRLAKTTTRVVDETETEVISLQMRNSNDSAPNDDRRQVIGVKASGETLVLAEYAGTFWSLLDSKWSLKQTSNLAIDAPLFELLGTRLVKVYSGRKLEYEPKHCTKLRNEQDFMTAVEFSKKNPYGKAVGLLDLKLGSIEAKENWLVLPGIVSAFILNSLLKKGGYSMKTNGLTEETKLETAAVETELKVEAMNVETEYGENKVEEGGHCGGGCGGGGSCGGGGGGSCGGGCGGSRCGGGGGGGCGGRMKNESLEGSRCIIPSAAIETEVKVEAMNVETENGENKVEEGGHCGGGCGGCGGGCGGGGSCGGSRCGGGGGGCGGRMKNESFEGSKCVEGAGGHCCGKSNVNGQGVVALNDTVSA